MNRHVRTMMTAQELTDATQADILEIEARIAAIKAREPDAVAAGFQNPELAIARNAVDMLEHGAKMAHKALEGLGRSHGDVTVMNGDGK